MSIAEKLAAAGITEAANLTEQEKALLEALSMEEQAALVDARTTAAWVNRKHSTGNIVL